MSNGNDLVANRPAEGVHDEVVFKRQGEVLHSLRPNELLAVLNDVGLAAYHAGLVDNTGDPSEKQRRRDIYYAAYLAAQQLLMGRTGGMNWERTIGV